MFVQRNDRHASDYTILNMAEKETKKKNSPLLHAKKEEFPPSQHYNLNTSAPPSLAAPIILGVRRNKNSTYTSHKHMRTHTQTLNTLAPPSLAAPIILGVWISRKPWPARNSRNSEHTPDWMRKMAWLVCV